MKGDGRTEKIKIGKEKGKEAQKYTERERKWGDSAAAALKERKGNVFKEKKTRCVSQTPTIASICCQSFSCEYAHKNSCLCRSGVTNRRSPPPLPPERRRKRRR